MTALARTWMSPVVPWLGALVLTVLAGCAATRKQDVLESRLRHQEDMLHRYEAQLERTKMELEIARRESASLRQQLAESGSSPMPREHIDAALRTVGLEFSTLMTGGTDRDGQPGDDGLSVVLVPQGPDGEVIRVPGTIEIEAFDLSLPGGAQRIGYWKFDVAESDRYWHKGVIQSGYQVDLPWQDLPQSSNLLLHGRLTAIDGRQFDTTYTLRINPPDPALVRDRPSQNSHQRIEQVSAVSGQDNDRTGDGRLPPARQSPSPDVFGHAKPGDPRKSTAGSLTSREFLERLRVGSPVRRGAAAHPAEKKPPAFVPDQSQSTKPAQSASPAKATDGRRPPTSTIDADLPPAIRDAPDGNDGHHEDEWWRHDVQRPAVQTSDSWTGATLPYLR